MGVAVSQITMATRTLVFLSAVFLVAVLPCRGQYAVLKVKATDSDGKTQLSTTCAAVNYNVTALPSAAAPFVSIKNQLHP